MHSTIWKWHTRGRLAGAVAGLVIAAGMVAALAATPRVARADTITGEVNVNATYRQTSDSVPVSASYYWINLAAYFSTPGDFTSGSVTYPGPGSPQALTPNGSTSFPALDYTSTTYPTLASLHADYPLGTYAVTASGPAGTQVSDVPYTSDLFTSSVPWVTNFGDLAGLDPTHDFTFYFPSFTPDPAATEAYTYLTIYDAATFNPAYAWNFLSPSTTSETLPAGTLLPGTDYFFELIYENRIVGTDTTHGTFWEELFDARTDGFFTTRSAVAVPEPAVLGVFGFGVLLIGAFVALRRRFGLRPSPPQEPEAPPRHA